MRTPSKFTVIDACLPVIDFATLELQSLLMVVPSVRHTMTAVAVAQIRIHLLELTVVFVWSDARFT